MLGQVFIAVAILSLFIWGLEISPLPMMPKRLLMAASVLIVAASMAHNAGLLK